MDHGGRSSSYSYGILMLTTLGVVVVPGRGVMFGGSRCSEQLFQRRKVGRNGGWQAEARPGLLQAVAGDHRHNEMFRAEDSLLRQVHRRAEGNRPRRVGKDPRLSCHEDL